MAQERERRLPLTQAGLVRYFEAEESIKVKPQTVIAICLLSILLVLILKFLA